ncbi:MAG: ribonuclease E/G, partial [Rhodospirillales bacterium]|nr:ribonuclease E/G [Rhodospirillales bacterium]
AVEPGEQNGEQNGDQSDQNSEKVETVGGDDQDDLESRRPIPVHRRYKIQEVIKRRQIILVQVVKEERGNKGAALTTYLSLAGRYCVLMPNTARGGGGVSRKITSANDRKRLKKTLADLEIPSGMGVIVRTAGSEHGKAEIKRDYDYLLRLWNNIRELTLESTAPCLVHEEGNLIKRSIRDLYNKDIEEIFVEGDEGYRIAKDFMKLLIPSHSKKVQPYRDTEKSLLQRFQVEDQLAAMHSPVVQLKSGGYIVINSTEALVAIDVNSGRATKERNIEETAFKTNLEAADEVARQLRLRDLAGLIVIDFIDMEVRRNQTQVERRLKEAMKNDRARIQLGRISPFGLLELSRQRLRPSLFETTSDPCPYCEGTGARRSVESTALHVLRAIEEEGARKKASEITVHLPSEISLYILNQKRMSLIDIETRYKISIYLNSDESLIPPDYRIERIKLKNITPLDEAEVSLDEAGSGDEQVAETAGEDEDGKRRRRRRPRKRRRSEEPQETETSDEVEEEKLSAGEAAVATEEPKVKSAEEGEEPRKRRRRGRRGGRRRPRNSATQQEGIEQDGLEKVGGEAEGEPILLGPPEDSLLLEGPETPPSLTAPEEKAEDSPESESNANRGRKKTVAKKTSAKGKTRTKSKKASAETPETVDTAPSVDDRALKPEPAPVEYNPVPESESPNITASSHESEPEDTGLAAVITVDSDGQATPAREPRRGWWKRMTE